jgi:hypothetical protein
MFSLEGFIVARYPFLLLQSKKGTELIGLLAVFLRITGENKNLKG